MKKVKKLPFRFRPYTRKVNKFIKSLNPDQHYMNCYSVEAVWFYDKSSFFTLYFDYTNRFFWDIYRVGKKGEFGFCESFKEVEEVVLEKIKLKG
jgi:hypothetical protein